MCSQALPGIKAAALAGCKGFLIIKILISYGNGCNRMERLDVLIPDNGGILNRHGLRVFLYLDAEMKTGIFPLQMILDCGAQLVLARIDGPAGFIVRTGRNGVFDDLAVSFTQPEGNRAPVADIQRAQMFLAGLEDDPERLQMQIQGI